MKKLLLSASILVAASATAFAADLPSRRAPPVYVPPVPVFSWTGVYIGGQIGYEFGKSSYAYNTGVAAASYSPNGVVGGAHVGYNWSSQGLFGNMFGNLLGSGGVIGLEGDVNGSNYNKSIAAYPGAAFGTGTRTSIDGSIRGRIGFAVDRALFYATGGAAFADLRNNYYNFGALGGFGQTFSHTRVGWTVGGGIEYAITNNWSVRGEYRYTDYGAYADFPYGGTALAGVGVRHHETDNRVQVGFSYKFDTFGPVPGPVVAKY